jgi:hypothetical protein
MLHSRHCHSTGKQWGSSGFVQWTSVVHSTQRPGSRRHAGLPPPQAASDVHGTLQLPPSHVPLAQSLLIRHSRHSKSSQKGSSFEQSVSVLHSAQLPFTHSCCPPAQ